MIKQYFFSTSKDEVYTLYMNVMGATWPIEREQFYDVLVHKPPAAAVTSFFYQSEGKTIGFVSTQIIDGRGSIVLLLFESGQEFVGKKLLKKVLEHFQKNKIKTAQLGAGGYSYFWPGIPANLPIFGSFFEEQGWQFRETSADMVLEIGDYHTPKGVYERITTAGVNIEFLKSDEVTRLLDFEKHHFPSWQRYYSERAKNGKFNEILIAKTTAGTIVGSVLVGKSVVIWANMLGNNLGTIGCLGVAENMRGKGIGLALAARATEALKAQKVRCCYLSWTWLIDWYGKLGYTVWREYRMSEKELKN